MPLKKEDVEKYLHEVKKLVEKGKFNISPREKNEQLMIDYILRKEDRKKIILSLTVEDFCGVVNNIKPGYEYELLYIFGKKVELMPRFGDDVACVSLYIKFNKIGNDYVVVVSFHLEERPLTYVFKNERRDKT